MHCARLIDKLRLHSAKELPEDYVRVLGHKHGTDGQFLKHFGLTFEQVAAEVDGKSDQELSAWFESAVEDFSEKKDAWNELAPHLGKEGYPMHRALKYAVQNFYKAVEWDPSVSTFQLIDLDEGRA